MKLAASNLAWDIKDDNKIIDKLKMLNYNAIEIAPTKIVSENPYDNIDKFIKYKNSIGMNICSLQSIWYGKNVEVFKNEDNLKEMILYTKQAIDLASSLNCNNLVFGNPKFRNINNKYEYELALKFFKEVSKYAFEKNVYIALEANPSIYDTNFINDSKSCFEFIKNLNLNGLKVNYDIGTALTNNENIDVIDENIDLINHVHISMPYLKPIIIEEKIINIINKLKNNNYDKYVSIEMGQIDDHKELFDIFEKVENLVNDN